jgi:hypothetical protein
LTVSVTAPAEGPRTAGRAATSVSTFMAACPS